MKHLGGPSAVSWPVFWITLVVAYFALLAGSPDLAAVNPLIRLLTVLAGEAALFAVLGIGQPIWLRCASRLRPWIALLVFAIASAASAVAQGYADVALGLVEDPAVLIRIPVFVALMTTTLCLAVITTDLRRQHQRRLRALERGNDELRRLKSTLLEEAEAARTQTVQLLAADVLRAIGGREQGDPTQIAAELRGLADDVIRPLSRELMAIPPDLGLDKGAIEAHSRRLNLGAWADEVTAPPLIHWAGLVGIMTLLSFAYGWATFGLTRGAVLGIATLVTLALVSWLINLAYSALAPHLGTAGRCAVALGALVAMSLVTAISWWQVSRGWQFSQTITVAAPIPAIVAALLASAHAAASRREQLEAEQMELNRTLRWQVAHTREALRFAQLELARDLHGPVYSAVMAAGLQFQAAARGGEPIDATAAARMRDLILASWPDPQGPRVGTDVNYEDALSQLIGLWRGVCDIEVQMTDDSRRSLHDDPACASAFIAVVTEACGNAVRHGAATHVRIAVSLTSPNVLAVSATDDGTPQVAAAEGEAREGDIAEVGPTGGLGSRLLDAVTLQWSLTRVGSATVLAAQLAVQPVGDGG